MKITFLAISALAAMLFAGCTSSDELTTLESIKTADNTPTPVQFGTYMGKTRAVTNKTYSAGPITTTSLPTARFGVFAYLTQSDYSNTTPTSLAPNFMYNQEIQYDDAISSGSWIYSPVKYWPNGNDAGNSGDPSNTAVDNTSGSGNQYGKKLSFFAFAPFMTTATFGTDGTGTAGTNYPTAIGDNSNFKTVATPDNGIVAMTTNAFTGNVWVKYLLKQADEDKAIDLLWGTNGKTTYNEADGSDPTLAALGAGYNMNLTKQANNEKVAFLFKHALAKIQGGEITTSKDLDVASTNYGISVKLDVDGNSGDNQTTFFGDGNGFNAAKTLVTIKSVKIQDRATAKTAGYTTSTTTTNDLWKDAWFNIETGAWDYTGAQQNATLNITIQNDKTADSGETHTYTLNPNIRETAGLTNTNGSDWQNSNLGNQGYTGGPTGVTVAAQALYANEFVPGVMLLPNKDQDIYVTIDYIIRTADANLATGYTEVEQVITNKVTLPAASLKTNQVFKLILHLGLTSVKFEAKVADWQTKSDSSIDSDGHETGGTDPNKNEKSIWLPSNVVD